MVGGETLQITITTGILSQVSQINSQRIYIFRGSPIVVSFIHANIKHTKKKKISIQQCANINKPLNTFNTLRVFTW